MIAARGRDLDPAQHARQFFHGLILAERGKCRASSLAVRQLADADVVMPLAGHLGQVGHAQHLPLVAQLPQSPAHDFGDAAADAGIDLVEDEAGNARAAGGDDLNGQGDPG